MANTINYASIYLQKLDEAYKKGSVTQALMADNSQYKFDNIEGKSVYISEVAIEGLGSYSRSTGYDSADITWSWRAYTFSQERSKRMTVDAVDSREAYINIGNLLIYFYKQSVIPELDAYRFEAICTACSLDINEDLTYDNVLNAIDTGIKTLDDAEVPKEDRVLYVSNDVYKHMKNSGELTVFRDASSNNGVVSRDIMTYDGMPVIPVPSARFISDFDYSATDGFSAATGSYNLNFMIVYTPAVLAIIKHEKMGIQPPSVNIGGQDVPLNISMDAYSLLYRVYHDCFLPYNKRSGIYISGVTTAN